MATATTDGTGRVAFNGMCGNFTSRPEKNDFLGLETQIQRVFNNVDASMFLEWTTYQVYLVGDRREAQALVEVTAGSYAVPRA